MVQHQVEVGLRRQAAGAAGEHASEPVVPCTQAAGQVVPDRPAERVVDSVVVALNKQAVQAQEVVVAPVDVELPVVPVVSAPKLLEQVPVVEPVVEQNFELIAQPVAADAVAVVDVAVVAAAIAAGFAVAAVDDTGAALPVTARTASVVQVEPLQCVLVQAVFVLPELSVAARAERPEFVEIEFAD